MNSSFSQKLSTLQLAVDSTSINAFMHCPRDYQLSILEGWRPKAQQIDLEFGILYHTGTETYDRKRADGLDHEQAVTQTIKHMLCLTWNKELQRGWATDDSNKNRFTLLRSLVWYFEEHKEDSIQTLILASGKPAVELSFRLQLPYTSSTGEQFIYCGHFDRIGKWQGDDYVLDKKTTKYTLTPRYYEQFSPHNQFSGYAFAGKVAFGFETKGIIVDAAQIGVDFSRFERKIIPRSASQLDEWYHDLGIWLEQMDEYAQQRYWPMNSNGCYMCRLKAICGKPPEAREGWLKADFMKKVWDPLQVRGDI